MQWTSLSPHFLLMTMLMMMSTRAAQHCLPEVNCKAPDCRCWNDVTTPGGLAVADVPQIVLVSFSYAVNRGNLNDYLQVLNGLYNPNGCPAKSTFFIQGRDSSFDLVAGLFTLGHEIALTSETGRVPGSVGDWIRSFKELRARLGQVRIPQDQVRGVRSPSLYFGGDDQLWAMGEAGLSYDATCVTRKFVSGGDFRWPYTLDFAQDGPSCNVGKGISAGHPGLWEFLMPVLKFQNATCATPSACGPALKDQYDSFQLFFGNFMQHYLGNRTPFMMFLDPLWLSDQDHFQGTRKFLTMLRDSFQGTWVISYEQALQWMKNPVTMQNATTFTPWSC